MKKLFVPVLLLSVSSWLGAQTSSQPTYNQKKEQAQEKASGIKDAVDIVSGPDFQQTGANTGTLTWKTNNEAATNVNYGTNRANPAQKAYTPGGARDHQVQLTNLKPNTTYYYEIETRKGQDRFKGHFQTAAGATGSASGSSAGQTSATEAASGIKDSVDVLGEASFSQTGAGAGTLTWQTNKAAATRLKYGTDAGNLTQKASQAGGSTNHSVNLSGLKANTTYYYEIADQSGRARQKGQFQTK